MRCANVPAHVAGAALNLASRLRTLVAIEEYPQLPRTS